MGLRRATAMATSAKTHHAAVALCQLPGAAIAQMDFEPDGALLVAALGLGLAVLAVAVALDTQRFFVVQLSGALQSAALVQELVTTVRLNFLSGKWRAPYFCTWVQSGCSRHTLPPLQSVSVLQS